MVIWPKHWTSAVMTKALILLVVQMIQASDLWCLTLSRHTHAKLHAGTRECKATKTKAVDNANTHSCNISDGQPCESCICTVYACKQRVLQKPPIKHKNTHGVNVRVYSSDFSSHKNKTAPPLSRSPADRGQSFGDCLALPLFGTPRVSMSAPVQMHMACHTWSLATTTHGPVPQPAVTDKCPHTVWLSDQSVWVTKTGPRADSAPVNCHFLLSGSSLSCLLDPTYGYVFI